MSNYEKFLRANMKVIGGARWDEMIRQIAADFAGLSDRASIQDKLADSLLARGLQVIEDLVTPVSLQAQGRVDEIDHLITQGTEDVNEAVAHAVAAAQNIADILENLQGQGVSADLVLETAARLFLTPTLKAVYDGYAAEIEARATPADIAAAISAYDAALKDGVDPAYDTLLEIAANLTGNDTAIAGLLTALGLRLRFDAAQTLNSGQLAQARANLQLGDVVGRNVSTAAELLANSGDKVVTAGNAWQANGWVNLGNKSGTVTIDANTGVNFQMIMTGNVVIDITNGKPGQAISIACIQDATGGRSIGWASGKFAFPNGILPQVYTPANQFALIASIKVWSSTVNFVSGFKTA